MRLRAVLAGVTVATVIAALAAPAPANAEVLVSVDAKQGVGVPMVVGLWWRAVDDPDREIRVEVRKGGKVLVSRTYYPPRNFKDYAVYTPRKLGGYQVAFYGGGSWDGDTLPVMVKRFHECRDAKSFNVFDLRASWLTCKQAERVINRLRCINLPYCSKLRSGKFRCKTRLVRPGIGRGQCSNGRQRVRWGIAD